MADLRPAAVGLRTRLFQIIFESDSRLAKSFDIGLILMILASVAVVMLDSVDSYHSAFGTLFYEAEWAFTLLFTLELAARLYCLERPLKYLTSFYGVIDLLSILPTWLALLFPWGQSLLVVRLLRVLRIFRVLRLMQFVGEGRLLIDALKNSWHQILLFLFGVLMVVIIFSSLVYLIEPPEAGFSNIPTAVYWGVVTLTTVGYGDITPVTPLGQFISMMVMLIGYSIIAVPTGVFSAEVIRSLREQRYSNEACPGCGLDRHEHDSRYCRRCGTWLDEDTQDPRLRDEADGASQQGH
ncbi:MULTISPECIES: ion transporter [Chromohalobacter]|uniref:Ion transport protein n=1 Tax=Chromohalobacter israelensis (strain ATCC BAA-138 / DSM 3043 / CIP 106854 / NCIMB 13768 / 1H11) TaxID=290398 RepID=Q1QZN8_CHRI1|nr:ion transporter [Chromohalobacter salexigens]ABE58070.1 Ion transport protein [Chromohalobacter salexigens DSM 3043]MDO0944149.1 ion transporter [Chromohalobacter salexigens]NWO56058.1 ion transporter [Chromohalobacter salexigens]